MSRVEDNKALIQRYTEAVWQGTALDATFHAADSLSHPLPSPSSVSDLAQTAGYFRAALPDLTVSESLIFGQDDRVMQYYTVSGTHTGSPLFDIPASGRTLTVAGENIFRIRDSHIVETWSIIDAAGVFQQLSAQ